jgi:8-oxo-dGTP pyrophosphatase MutT (NUDIX family)
MIAERSAGVVVYLQGHDSRQYLLLDYGRHWDFPKGHLEAGEDDRTAARRELFEETGIDKITLDPSFHHEIEYFFRNRNGELIHKTVAFFLGRAENRQVTLSDEHVDHVYCDYATALKKATYPNAREILRLADKHLARIANDDKLS